MENAHLAEAIYLFADGQVAAELPFAEFMQHVERQTSIPDAPPGASLCRAGYVVVGPDLLISGLVFFLLQVDEQGRPDKNFNVPLPYLAKNAGLGPDLGSGPIPMACRGSCSVPWHANNLWDPTQDDATNPFNALIAAVAANRLDFNPEAISATPENDACVGATALNVPGTPRAPSARVTELSARHTEQLIALQEQHEYELATQREVLEAKLELYRQEVVRLRDELAERQPTVVAKRGVSNSD